MGWYALFVETGKEEQVKKHIHNTMSFSNASIPYELLIAKREIREKKDGIVRTVVKRMFPGYILLETEEILEFYSRLKTTRCEHYSEFYGMEVISKKSDLKKFQTLYI